MMGVFACPRVSVPAKCSWPSSLFTGSCFRGAKVQCNTTTLSYQTAQSLSCLFLSLHPSLLPFPGSSMVLSAARQHLLGGIRLGACGQHLIGGSRLGAWGQHLLRGSRPGAWGQNLLRGIGSVYTAAKGFQEKEIREKLQAFPGGSIDLVKQESGIAVLTVNNPARMNAFSGSMMVELEERVSQLEEWTEGKGLIIQGAAGTFCSGSDLNAVRAISNPQDGMKMCTFMQNALTRLLRLPLLSVALVEGNALGGGAELTTACDFRLMAPGGVIQFVHKHMGLVPGWGGAARLVRIVGGQNALKMLGGALKIDPEMGLQIGLADGVLEGSLAGSGANALLEAEQWLGCYTAGPAPVIRAIKSVVVSGRELPLEVALGTERDVFGTVWGGPANLQALATKAKHK